MPRGERLSKARIEPAIREHATLSAAAKALGCTREALSRAVTRWGMRGLLSEAREELCDLAEDSLRRQVLADDVKAVTYTLDTLGKRRGYIRRIPDAIAASNLDALGRVLAALGVHGVDEMRLIEAVKTVKAEIDAERGGGPGSAR